MKSWCVFDVAGKEKEIETLEKESAAPDFWNDQTRAQAHMRRLSSLQDEVTIWRDLSSRVNDALDLLDAPAEDELIQRAHLDSVEFLGVVAGGDYGSDILSIREKLEYCEVHDRRWNHADIYDVAPG